MKDQESIYLECDCGHNDHMMKMSFVAEDHPFHGYVYASMQMSPSFGFWARIWEAIKYVCGKESRYGHWDCISLDYGKLKRVQKFLDAAIEEVEKKPMIGYQDTPHSGIW